MSAVISFIPFILSQFYCSFLDNTFTLNSISLLFLKPHSSAHVSTLLILAQDCKHKENIKGANEKGNEERQVGQMNQ